MGAIRIGCSGWNYDSWRGRLYPKGLGTGRWLERYAQVFDTVEVNATFYRLASEPAVRRWAEQTPGGFVFALKASRYLTHVKKLDPLEPGIERFYAPLEPLSQAGKLGPIVWQLPPWFDRDDARLRNLIAHVPPGRHAIEFRHPSWFVPGVLDLLNEAGMAMIIGDDPRRPWVPVELTTDWTLVRFHRGRRGRRGNYSNREIAEWAQRIGELARDADVYAYFNNDWEGFAVENAKRLGRELGKTLSARRGSGTSGA
jgi:uncharacterized protein YecE (DUF72 family)